MALPNEIRRALARLHPCPHLQQCEQDWREKARRKFPGKEVEPLWQKDEGRVPCGFSGASDGPEKVKVVFVIAEPSQPKVQPLGDVPNEALLEKVYQQSTNNLRVGHERHHTNLKDGVLQRFFPNSSFDELMRRSFVTCSVYCSNPKPFDSSADPPKDVQERCGKLHLIEVLKKFPHAEIVALGGKADRRLANLVAAVPDAPRNIHERIRAAHPMARPKDHPVDSWEKAAIQFAERQGRRRLEEALEPPRAFRPPTTEKELKAPAAADQPDLTPAAPTGAVARALLNSKRGDSLATVRLRPTVEGQDGELRFGGRRRYWLLRSAAQLYFNENAHWPAGLELCYRAIDLAKEPGSDQVVELHGGPRPRYTRVPDDLTKTGGRYIDSLSTETKYSDEEFALDCWGYLRDAIKPFRNALKIVKE